MGTELASTSLWDLSTQTEKIPHSREKEKIHIRQSFPFSAAFRSLDAETEQSPHLCLRLAEIPQVQFDSTCWPGGNFCLPGPNPSQLSSTNAALHRWDMGCILQWDGMHPCIKSCKILEASSRQGHISCFS